MSDRDELSVRKDLLVAQSSVYRAQLRYELAALRASVSEGTSVIAKGMKLVAIVRTVLSVLSFLRR